MHAFALTYEVVGSGAGIAREVVTATSEFSARRFIEATSSGQAARIHSTRRLSSTRAG